MRRQVRQIGARFAAVLAGMLLVALTGSAPAYAAEGTIDHVEVTDDGLRILYSIPGIGQGVIPDIQTVTVEIEGQSVEATADLAADSQEGVRRTTVLAIDVSQSMQGERFEEAKDAAQMFLEAAPVDVFVGIVTFAQDVTVVQPPTLDHDAASDLVNGLELSLQTRLYDGIKEAVRAAGPEGQRSVLVLSDGGDTSSTALSDVARDISDAEIQVDVVALAQSPANRQELEVIAKAGNGVVLETDDPRALSQMFEREAEALAKQVLVSAILPDDLASREGTAMVSIEAGGQTYTDSAFVTVQQRVTDPVEAVLANPERTVSSAGSLITPKLMLAGLAAIGAGGLLVLLSAFGLLSPKKATSVEDRIAAYSNATKSRMGVSPDNTWNTPARPSADSLRGSARAVAEKALAGNKGMEARLASRLDAAGMSIKPAEWLLTQAGVAFGAAILGMLFGSLLWAVISLALGAIVPYIYLNLKKSRRVKAFNNQLADTLQLMAGSLSAGLSLAQSADTVVREGSEPMTSEFKRALIEARLGVAIEDSFESIAERMHSEDFRWVVMAVRIQREVGGNLSEVLTQVSATIRERAYLRRQVKSLSAEGILSAYIVGGLPLGVLAFLATTRPGYLEPMVSTGIGWVMFGVGTLMMMAGAFWLRQIVRMEV